MTLILTNDDGIDAPGIRSLLQAVNGKKIIIAAPKDHLSGCGHQVTTQQAIDVEQRAEFEYAISGTPADCTRIALAHLCPQAKFVLSGINAGGNLGADVYISGTIAAVREAVFHGIPGIAVSHYLKRPLLVDWELAAKMTAKILDDLLQRPFEPGSFWNVNLPHLSPGDPEPEIVFCQPCIRPLPIKYRVEGNKFYYAGVYAQRDRTPGSDVDVCFSGKVAVTKLHL